MSELDLSQPLNFDELDSLAKLFACQLDPDCVEKLKWMALPSIRPLIKALPRLIEMAREKERRDIEDMAKAIKRETV